MSTFATYVKTHLIYYRNSLPDIDRSIIKKDINDSRGNRWWTLGYGSVLLSAVYLYQSETWTNCYCHACHLVCRRVFSTHKMGMAGSFPLNIYWAHAIGTRLCMVGSTGLYHRCVGGISHCTTIRVERFLGYKVITRKPYNPKTSNLITFKPQNLQKKLWLVQQTTLISSAHNLKEWALFDQRRCSATGWFILMKNQSS